MFNFNISHIDSLFAIDSSFVPPASAERFEFRVGGQVLLEYFDWESQYGQVVTPSRTYVTKMRGQLRVHTEDYKLATLAQNKADSEPQLFFALNDHCLSYKSMFTGLDFSGIINRADALEMQSHFARNNKPMFSVHGVAGQCHIWTRLDQIREGVDVRNTNFQTFGSIPIPQSMISGIGIAGFGQLNRNKWLADSTENGFRYKTGTILSPPDGFCVFHAILQVTRFDEDDLSEFVSMVKVMFAPPKGWCSLPQLGALLYNTGIVAINQRSIFDNLGGQLHDSPKNYTLVYSQSHCFAWIPNGKSDKDKVPLSLINENFSIMLEKSTLAKVSFNLEVQSSPIPEPCVPRAPRKTQSKPSLQATQVSVQEVPKKQVKIWVDPRKLFLSKLIAHVDSELQTSPYVQMNDYNRDECKAWNDIYFFYQYERIIPVSLPFISCKTSLRIATSISRQSFPNLYACDQETHPLKFQEPIPASLGSRMEIVSKSALNTLGASKIISLHQPRSTQLQGAVEQKKKMISGYRSVQAQPNGLIDRECLEILAKYGIQVDTSLLKQNSTCGGHAFLRYVVDLLQCNSLTRILKDTRDQLIVDVGAKYGSNFSILKNATRLHGIALSSQVDDHFYRIKYIQQNLNAFMNTNGYVGTFADIFRQVSLIGYTAYPSTEWSKHFKFENLHPILRDCFIHNLVAEDQRQVRITYLQEFADIEAAVARGDAADDAHATTHPHLNPLVPLTFSEIVLKFSKHIFGLPVLQYMPIRPNDTDYNKLYHSECSIKYREGSYEISHPGQCMALDIGIGYIQEYEATIIRNRASLSAVSEGLDYFREMGNHDLLSIFTDLADAFDVGALQLLQRMNFQAQLGVRRRDEMLYSDVELRQIANSEADLFSRCTQILGWSYDNGRCTIPADFPDQYLEICGSITHEGGPCSLCPQYANRLGRVQNPQLAFILSQFTYGDRQTCVKQGSPVPPFLQILRNIDFLTISRQELTFVSYSGSQHSASEAFTDRMALVSSRYNSIARVGGMEIQLVQTMADGVGGVRRFIYSLPAQTEGRANQPRIWFPQLLEVVPVNLKLALSIAFEYLYPREGHFRYVAPRMAGKSDVVVSLFMNDVHYYLADYAPSFSCLMYITGCDFYPFPGFYTLPCGEGSVVITARADHSGQVCMQTQGSGIPYDHDLVRIRDHTFRIDYGWFSHFQKIHRHSAGDKSIIQKIYVPKVKELKSIQQSFVLQSFNLWGILEKTNISTLTPIQEEARQKCYRLADIEDILRTGFLKTATANTSFMKRVSKFLLERVSTVDHMKVNSFVNAMNYSTMSRMQDYSELRLLGGLFTSSYENAYGLYPEFNDDNLGSLFHRRQVNVQQVEDKAQILLAGRTDVVRQNAHAIFGSSLHQLPIRDQCYLFSQSKPKASSTIVKQDLLMTEFSDYYFVKPVPPMPLQNVETIPDHQSFQRLSTNYNSWKDLHGERVESYSKRGFSLFDQKCVKRKCGYDVISDGQVVQSFEWGAKAVQNAASAFVGRQINSLTVVDLEELKIFQRISMRYVDTLVSAFQKDENLIRSMRSFDPLVWIADKSSFDEGKKQKYFRTLVKQQQSSNPSFIGSFKTMVKSGEVQFSENPLEVESGFLIGQDSRPRNISIPCATSCGFLTAVQSILFPAIQRVDPGFVQACTKEELTARYRTALGEIKPEKSISLDGSSFDSTQFQLLQECVDVYFWKQLQPLLDSNLCLESVYVPVFRDIFIQNLVRDACLTTHQLFVTLPGTFDYDWSDDELKIFKRDWPNEDINSARRTYIPISIKGTTFSGHPTATTLGNTLRSICYIHYYAFKANIPMSDLRYFAAGDDVNIFVRIGLEDLLMSTILLVTNRVNSPQPGTLGQIIKDIRLSHWSDVDFCSKWSFADGTYESFYFTRDCKKTLATRLFYSGKLNEFHNNPDLYVSALLEGFRSEHLSVLIEDIFEARLQGSFITGQSEKLSHSYEQCGSYKFQDRINSKLGLTLASLLDVISLNKLQLLAGRSPIEAPHTKQLQSNSYFLQPITVSLPTISAMNLNDLSSINKQMKALYKERQKLYKQDPKVKKVASGLNEFVTVAKNVTNLPKLTYAQVRDAYSNAQDPMHARIISLVNHLQQKSPASLLKAIGVKIATEADPHFSKLSFDQQKSVLAEVLADDWAPIVKSLSAAALPHIWNMTKNSSYGKKALSILKDYLGIDLNDDNNMVLGPYFSRNASCARTIEWADFSPNYASEISAYDGVNTQAIASMLMPELCKSRVPSDTAIRCGLVNKSFSTTLTTNAAGNAGFILRPQLLTGSGWIWYFFDSTFSPTSWTQTPSAVPVSGPLSGLSSVTSFRVTSTSIEIHPIVSQLNNQGQLTTCMNDDETSAISSTSMPVNSTTVRDSQYVTYGNIAGCSGHRMLYHNDSSSESQFFQYGSTNLDNDYMAIVVTGGAPSANVLQLTITYQAEFTTVGNVLVDMLPTSPGPATLKCLASALSINPHLRLLGHQECVELYTSLISTPARYQSVLETLTTQKFHHHGRQILTSQGQSPSQMNFQALSQDASSFSEPSILP